MLKLTLYTILHVTSFLLSEWRNVRTKKKSRLQYKIDFDLYYNLRNK